MTARQWYLGIAVATAAAAFAPVSANAIPNLVGSPDTQIQIQFHGVTVENAGTVGVGGNGGSCNGDLSVCIETTWGVGVVTGSLTTANVPIWVPGDGGQTLGFVLYGVADESISGVVPNINIANTGATTGPNGAGNSKINIDIYTFTTADQPCFFAGCGANPIVPGDRNANVGGIASVTHITTGTHSGTLFAHLELVPGIDPLDSTTTMVQNVNASTLPAAGSGFFYADCVSGPACVGPDREFSLSDWGGGVIATFFGAFELKDNSTFPTADFHHKELVAGWPGDTKDPLNNGAPLPVPEPASMGLLGSALAFLGVAIHRRRRNGISA